MRLNFKSLERETLVKFPPGGAIVKGGPKKPWINRKTGEPYTYKDGTPKLIQGDDLDHFRFVPHKSLQGVTLDGYPARDGELDMAQILQQRWQDVFGLEPKRLNILFLSPHLSDVFSYGNKAWAGSRSNSQGGGFLIRECDGAHITQERQDTVKGFKMILNPTEEDGSPKRCACLNEQGEEITQECPLGCTARASLTVVLPDLGVPRQFTLRTGAANDIREIMRNLRPFDGALNATPFRLVRTKRPVLHRDAEGIMHTVEKWLIHIELTEANTAQFLAAQTQRNFKQLSGREVSIQEIEDDNAFWDGEVTEGELINEMPEKILMIEGSQSPKGPSRSSIGTIGTANARAQEVASLRKQHGLSAAEVCEMIQKYEGASNDNPPTHPAQLSDADYQELLERIASNSDSSAIPETAEPSWNDV